VGDRVGTHGSSRLSRAADRVGSMLISWRSRAVKAWGHFPAEQAAVKCVYMAIMSLDPTGKGRQRWSNRWKPALNAFTVAFPGRIINQAK
jgi:transposase-like protein